MKHILADFLQRLARSGAPSDIQLEWEVRPRPEARTRGVIYAESMTNGPPPTDAPDLKKSDDPYLHVNEYLTLRMRSPRSGRLHLFNLGTSGRMERLFPRDHWPLASVIQAGKLYAAPGNLVPPAFFPDGVWKEIGPTSERFGYPERVLAIVTEPSILLEVSDLHEGLAPASTRGGFAGAEEVVARLFTLPRGSWSQGLLEIWVKP